MIITDEPHGVVGYYHVYKFYFLCWRAYILGRWKLFGYFLNKWKTDFKAPIYLFTVNISLRPHILLLESREWGQRVDAMMNPWGYVFERHRN